MLSTSWDPQDCAVIDPWPDPYLMTLDYGPAVASSPYRSGRIAAAHALSDVFAMGGTPQTALSVLIVDPTMPDVIPAEVLAGMIEYCAAEGTAVAGGHTVVGSELMAGLSVIGRAGERILTKRGARAGDLLMLSKPLGTGLALRAWRQGIIDDETLEPVLAAMELSNRGASRATLDAHASAGTDVTGNGLAGHLSEMLGPHGLGASLSLDAVPIFDAAQHLPDVLGHSKWIDDNLAYCRQRHRLSGITDRRQIAALLDPQTSGGLLVAVDPEGAAHLTENGFRRIGFITAGSEIEITP